MYLSTIRVKIWENNRISNYGVKVEIVTLRLPLFQPVKIDHVPDHRAPKAEATSGPDAFEGHFVPLSSSLDADHCSLFAGFLRSFVRNTVAENSTWSMSQGSQSIGS